MNLYLDLETYSEVPLNHGTHRYAEQAEVLLTAMAVDDDPVEVFEGWPGHMARLLDEADTVVVHNAKFDIVVLGYRQVGIPISQVHCTMAHARSCSLPGGLGALCDVLQVPTDKAKDKAGRQLIQLFCKPLPKNRKLHRATKHTHPVEWARFIDYAGLDVVAMRELHRRLPKWNYTDSPFELELWRLDQVINARGFQIDVELAEAAIEAVRIEQQRLGEATVELTDGDVERTSQRDRLLAHILATYGVELPDLQKGTLERRVQDEELPAVVRELLAIRLEASATSTAKYQALIKGVSADGRLRGALEWCGASRTGRWSGKMFQPHNLPRTPGWFTRAEQRETIAALKAGAADLVYTDVMKRCSLAIRGSIIAAPGQKLVACDLKNIEGRVIAWLAGEEWKLDAFRDYDQGLGPDLYLVGAGTILEKPWQQVTEDERQAWGKVPELACGFQGAVDAFMSMAHSFGLDMTEHEALVIVMAWRRRNDSIVSFWYDCERKAVAAMKTPGTTITSGRLRFRLDGAWLKIVLPSGRALCYPAPRLERGRCPPCRGTGRRYVKNLATGALDIPVPCFHCKGHGEIDDAEPRVSYSGINQYTRQWGRVHTYGGKLAENVTQAVARDVLADAMIRAEAAGFDVVLTVHDEIVTEVPDTPSWSVRDLVSIMTHNPAWADGLPLAASGFEGQRYGKEG